MIKDLAKLRNIGISAHIDSGKTTLTERILFYTNRIHAIHDVRGKDGVGAKMDSMELERERGITIASAATHCSWQDHHVNIIDTPGHVDFTIEVERALRVLDGAVLVLCAVAGVQSQSMTVDRQMRRYHVPRIAFVNKCDRVGANPLRVANQLREQLGHNPIVIQLPIGLENKFEGIIDLVAMEAMYFHGDNGEKIERAAIPAEYMDQVNHQRELLLDGVSMFSDELMEAMLEERVTTEIIHRAIRQATLAHQITPVMLGSAYKNKGVQPLLNAVVQYLPNPMDVTNEALEITPNGEVPVALTSDPEAGTVALAFKLEDGRYGQLTYLRIYQGRVERDSFIHNTRSGKKHRVGRLVRMHSDEMEEITEAAAGDIVAVFGIDCYTGDTFTDGSREISMTSMHVPNPVISMAIKPVDKKAEINVSKALSRFTKEDPTFRVRTDPESNETIISGMGELHLDVYVERMKREYGAEVETSPPRVAYRETLSRRIDFNYLHKKQTGGSGQYGRVAGYLEPTEEEFEFVDEIVGGSIPRQYIASVEKGFRSMLEKGTLIGSPVVNVRVVINDGASHAVDSSEMAFQEAARGAWREAFPGGKPKIKEPVMKVVVEGPAEFSGGMLGTLMSRRGQIVGSEEGDGMARIQAEVPLAEMFGYSTQLRSNTKGKAEFSMEFSRYLLVPEGISKELIEKAQAEKK